jgi:hypothetical protein
LIYILLGQQKAKTPLEAEEAKQLCENILEEMMAVNISGYLTYREMKSYMTRKFIEINQ